MTKQELSELIKEDKRYYYGEVNKFLARFLTYNPLYLRGTYIITCRKYGYYKTNAGSLFNKLLFLYYTRRKNVLGAKLHIELGPAEFGRRLRIYHNDIIVNAGAVIGDDCELYGNNCIGNKGSDSSPLEAPILGNHVSVGVGTQIIGKVTIGDHVSISSMSLVNKDIIDENAIYGGVPAKKLGYKKL